MSDLRYRATVDVSQAERSLSNLQKAVGGVNDTFIRLKTTLASISLGAVIGQSLQFADAVGDLSDATGIAIENILGFQAAVAASGGSVDGAQKALVRLVNSIGEAADGSAAMQQAFRDVGVTIDDLRRLSEQDILAKTIAGLDKMEDRAKRSVLVTQLLGKEFRNVAPGQLAQAYADATAQSARYADAIRAGAAAQQNIDKTLVEFKTGLLEALKPLNQFISEINIGVDKFQRFVQGLLAVGAAILTLTVAGRVATFIRVLVTSIGEIAAAVSGAITMIVNLVRNFGSFIANAQSSTSALRGLWTTITAVASELGTALGPAFGALKAVAVPVLSTIAFYWGWIQDSTEAAIRKVREYASALTFGLISPPDTAGGGRGNGQAELEQRKRDAEAAAQKERAMREVLDRQAQARAKINLELKQNIDNLAIGLSRQTEGIWNEARLIELSKIKNVISEDEVEIIKAQSAADVERLAALKKIEQEQEKLRQSLAYAKDEEKAGIQAQIAANDTLYKKTEEYYRGHGEKLRENITYLQSMRMLDAARVRDQEILNKSLEDQIQRQQQLGEMMQRINDQRMDINFERSLKGLTPLQKEVAKINENARKAALEAGRAFAAGFDNEDGLTPERAQELANGLQAIAQGYRDIAQAQIQGLGPMDEFTNGLQNAWETYKDNANDIAKQVKDSFDNFTSGMEDTFVRFVQTGKLSFKDLANSILADLARVAVKKAIIFFGTKLFGFADGGEPPVGVPSIVGEKGPELFVPKTAGTIIPNSALKGGPGGGFGMGIGSTTVNYNIQAVDAASFRALVARDPSFIYSVTEQGRRSQPTRSR